LAWITEKINRYGFKGLYSKVGGFALDFNMKEIAEEENKWSYRLQIFFHKSAWK